MNELPPDWIGIAAVISAVAALVTAVAVFFNSRRVKAIDHAVNGKPPGATTLVAQVQDLHDEKFIIEDAAVIPLLRRLVEEVNALKPKERKNT